MSVMTKLPPDGVQPRSDRGSANVIRGIVLRMKRMKFAGGAIITGSAVADALLDYATKLSGSLASVRVDVPVLETDGTTKIHTLLIGPASQFDVEEVAIFSPEEELELFPVPELPVIGVIAVAESLADAEADAAEFNQAVSEIDSSLS